MITQHKSPLNCGVEYNANGQHRMVIGSYTGEAIVLIKTEDGKIQFDRNVKFQENAIKGIGVSDTYIFSVCATGAAGFNDKITFEQAAFIKDGHDQIANGCVQLSSDKFASVSRDLCLRIWNTEGVEKFESAHRNSIKCVSSDDKGNFILSGDLHRTRVFI